MFNFEKLFTSQWLIKRAFQFNQLGQTVGSNLGENIGGFVGNAIGGKNLGQLIGKYYGAGDFLGGAAGSLMGGQRLGNIAGKNIGEQIGQNIGNVLDKGLGLLSQKSNNINVAPSISQQGLGIINSNPPATGFPPRSGFPNFTTLPYKLDKNKAREGVYNPLKPNSEQNNPNWSARLLPAPYNPKNPSRAKWQLL